MVTLSNFREDLHNSGDGVYIVVVDEMAKAAKGCSNYASSLQKWLSKGDSVFLRDELLLPLRRTGVFTWLAGEGVPCAFHNAWAAIDASACHVCEAQS